MCMCHTVQQAAELGCHVQAERALEAACVSVRKARSGTPTTFCRLITSESIDARLHQLRDSPAPRAAAGGPSVGAQDCTADSGGHEGAAVQGEQDQHCTRTGFGRSKAVGDTTQAASGEKAGASPHAPENASGDVGGAVGAHAETPYTLLASAVQSELQQYVASPVPAAQRAPGAQGGASMQAAAQPVVEPEECSASAAHVQQSTNLCWAARGLQR